MIVKIMQPENSNNTFCMFDNIARLSMSVLQTKPEEFIEDILLVNVETVRDYIWLRCQDIRGKEFTIAFDTIAYICNDAGKTIETIRVN